MMKSLKSIFSSCSSLSVSTKKQTRMCQKWTLSSLLKRCFFALNFFEFKREEPTFLFALLFIKNKATTREEKTKTKKPPTSSYTFATSSSPSMSSNRFFPFVSFSCFSCSNFCFAWSVLDAFRRDGRDDIFFSLFRFDSHFHKGQKNDRSIDESALWCLFLSSTTKKERERERCKKRL